MDSNTICGGENTRTTCTTLTSGQWVTSQVLSKERRDHCSWCTSTGIILLGGHYSLTSTETVIQTEYDTVPGFTMQNQTEYACSIPDKATHTLIITGGLQTMKAVTRYDTAGFLEYLPSLRDGRYYHGCGAYRREDDSQVLLVAGGYGKGGGLSSTELLPTNTSAWVKANPLPRKLYYVRGITMDGVLYMTGGYDMGARDEIYYWSEENWLEAGRMNMSRYDHAVSTINMDDEALQFCD